MTMSLFEALDRHTIDLVLDADRPPGPAGRASGVIVSMGAKLVAITAGHITKRGERWFIERTVAPNTPAILIPLNGLTSVFSTYLTIAADPELVEVAWATVDRDRIRTTLRGDARLAGKQLDLPTYSGPLDARPSNDTTYAFVAHNRAFLDGNRSELVREYSFEFGMRYEGRHPKTKLHRFLLADTHMGHDYYRGASGAPIADENGTIVSLLICGSPKENAVYGFPLADYARVIGL